MFCAGVGWYVWTVAPALLDDPLSGPDGEPDRFELAAFYLLRFLAVCLWLLPLVILCSLFS